VCSAEGVPHGRPLTRTPRNRDIAGSLRTILENAPYGPNVEDAKVSRPLFLTPTGTTQAIPVLRPEPQPPDARHHTKQHQSDRHTLCHQIAIHR
jgi:hypothetical protein